LDPVAQAELGEDPLDVDRDGGLGGMDPSGDLRVRPPAGQVEQHLVLARGEAVEAPPDRVSDGLRLSRNPLAPARTAGKTYSSSSKGVRISTRAGRPRAVISAVAVTPSLIGMRTSISTMSATTMSSRSRSSRTRTEVAHALPRVRQRLPYRPSPPALARRRPPGRGPDASEGIAS
jgi:hypothetical protein